MIGTGCSASLLSLVERRKSTKYKDDIIISLEKCLLRERLSFSEYASMLCDAFPNGSVRCVANAAS